MVAQNRIGEFLADNPSGGGACYTFLFGEPGGDLLFARLFELQRISLPAVDGRLA